MPFNRLRSPSRSIIGGAVLALFGVIPTGTSGSAQSLSGEQVEIGDSALSGQTRSMPLQSHGSYRKALSLPRTAEFSLAGLSWEGGPEGFGGTAQVRTRDSVSGAWSRWQNLDSEVRQPETAEGARNGTKGMSEPLWTGPSQGIEIRVDATGSGIPLPETLELVLVDPGKRETDTKAEGSAGATRGIYSAPLVITRAQWGADESLVEDPPAYLSKVDAAFVHHTAGTNSYSCAESPAIIRGILAYHVNTSGWNDIGYNFFVDKCGTIFEGRAGGIDRPVLGAHTYGFNTVSAGIAVLGNYEEEGIATTPEVGQAVADIAAWKLGLHGVHPEGQVTLTAAGDTGVWNTGDRATLHRISGHRDGYATLCPGENLYAFLPEIRTRAGQSPYAVPEASR